MSFKKHEYAVFIPLFEDNTSGIPKTGRDTYVVKLAKSIASARKEAVRWLSPLIVDIIDGEIYFPEKKRKKQT